MKHSNAVGAMVLVAGMWSLAGVVTRHLQSAQGLEITFWRSVFAAATVIVWMVWMAWRRDARPLALLAAGGALVWASGLMWAVMFTCFMVALAMTRVANVLITQSLTPVFTALLAYSVLRKPVGRRTWVAIGVAAAGVASMYAFDVAGLDERHVRGALVALGVPTAGAVNWILLQRAGRTVDLSGAVLVGSVLSALAVLPLAWPLTASPHDIGLLAFLGVVQLGVPCLLVVRVARWLSAPEASLLALLEVVFGILLTWAFGSEQPGLATLLGGSAVLAALIYNGSTRPVSPTAESAVA
jgi:drug/metabolite transporter (DMT)-like permease